MVWHGIEIQDRYGNVVANLPDNYERDGYTIYKIETEFIEYDGKKMRKGDVGSSSSDVNSYSESNMNEVITKGKFIDDSNEWSTSKGIGVWVGYELRLLFKENTMTPEQKKVKEILDTLEKQLADFDVNTLNAQTYNRIIGDIFSVICDINGNKAKIIIENKVKEETLVKKRTKNK